MQAMNDCTLVVSLPETLGPEWGAPLDMAGIGHDAEGVSTECGCASRHWGH